jgi:hypothetical protein
MTLPRSTLIREAPATTLMRRANADGPRVCPRHHGDRERHPPGGSSASIAAVPILSMKGGTIPARTRRRQRAAPSPISGPRLLLLAAVLAARALSGRMERLTFPVSPLP